MASSNDNGRSILLPNNAVPQISNTIGVSQNGYPPRVPGCPPAYTEPGFISPETHPIPGYPQVGQTSPQGLNSSAPYPEDKYLGFPPAAALPQGGNLQGGPPLGGYPPQDYLQGGFPKESQDNVPIPLGYNDPEYMNKSTEPLDPEAGINKVLDFTEQTIRRAFIKKVYGILSCQLAITIGFIALFLFHEPTKRWTQNNIYMLYIALALYLSMAFSMICCSTIRRKSPGNLVFLGLFTVATGYLMGVITSTYDVETVMLAVGITAAVVVSLTLFAFQTKYDFTGCGAFLLCTLVILLCAGIMCSFLPPNRMVDTLYASVGALIFSLYLIYDTQLMLGGKHKFTISPEEYIFAALQLYLDIINLFIKILYLVGRR